MDFLKSQFGKGTTGTESGGDDKPEAEKHTEGDNQPASTGELLSDAKLVAGAAKSTFSNESDKVDRGKVSESAENLLDAASHYGKLEEKGLGSYVDKAEDYLHQYSSTTTTTVGSGGHSDAPPTTAHDSTNTTAPPRDEAGGGGGDGGSENKYGEYFKKAEGFLNKFMDFLKSQLEKQTTGDGGGHKKPAADSIHMAVTNQPVRVSFSPTRSWWPRLPNPRSTMNPTRSTRARSPVPRQTS
ncbi:hypothetical protein FNV43_RR26280 [Rhamnella rubrinervis]|uniref:Uncharacterized protein n=1 Tax=Rhamnella rubrinervis TaxID=2594499 RepID=A0A8K0DNS4_9ROSA|nr:hypothetical protein FNV43_RR26280 [Rhamnella rubrinervis]